MKQTARALITNHLGHCFLALHNHYLPENFGKWGTVGGIMDADDPDILHCLCRELAEEFSGVTNETFQIGKKLAEIEKNGVRHHFFRVSTQAEALRVSQPEEVIEARFFTFAEVSELKKQNKLYFDSEDELFAAAISS